jgi:molybdopterin converting factor small subunit
MATDTSIRVRVLQLGRRVMQHTGAPGITIERLLEEVGLTAAPGLDVRVNGRSAPLENTLNDGDVVTLIPRIKGGLTPLSS